PIPDAVPVLVSASNQANASVPAASAVSSVTEPRADGSPSVKVVVVDDLAVNIKLLKLQLTRLGCQIDVAWNGHEAVNAVQNNQFDIVFMDL
ncbi:response regulator, partial [Acinetobacter baumannii]